MALIFCNQCGQNYDDSKRHECPNAVSLADQLMGTNDSDSGATKQKTQSKPKQKPVSRPVKDSQTDQKSEPEPIPTKEPEPEKTPNKTHQTYDPNAAARAKRWRESNSERHKAYMREYMKAYRRKHQ